MFEYLLVVYDNESFGRFCKLYKWNERIGVYGIARKDKRKKGNDRNKENKVFGTKSDNGDVS